MRTWNISSYLPQFCPPASTKVSRFSLPWCPVLGFGIGNQSSFPFWVLNHLRADMSSQRGIRNPDLLFWKLDWRMWQGFCPPSWKLCPNCPWLKQPVARGEADAKQAEIWSGLVGMCTSWSVYHWRVETQSSMMTGFQQVEKIKKREAGAKYFIH